PEYDFSGLRGDQKIIGYNVSNVVRAKIRDLDKAGAAIDAATDAGGDDAVVQGIAFSIDDPTELQKQAREQAVEKAREQAEQLADNAGVKLGKLLAISESSYDPYKFDSFFLPASDAGSVTQTPVQTGELTIAVTVNLLYAVD
ncbi:MAG TPA: SIMPL domain-containing protein, partial [Dehalococcoidia bacterium]|nr:SIMPL domain-containing protein [Dehalococcoidia bacterium]